MTVLRFAPVTARMWTDFEALFETPGAPKYCWCMAWRHMPELQSATNADRKRAVESLVRNGTPVGMLAYWEDEPIGWCSIAPRNSLRKLSPQQDEAEEGVWSIVCFFVHRAQRRKKIASALLEAAVEHAFASGATTVEAYPVDSGSPSYRFMGFRDMFAARGFRETGMAGSRRHVMRLDRSAGATARSGSSA